MLEGVYPAMTVNNTDLEFYAEREKISVACRIMAMEGMVEGTLGHISMRVGDDLMLIRSRGPEDMGLLFSSAEEICLFDFSGNLKEPDRGYSKPVELPLHGETFRARLEANVVLHAHPPAVLAATLANLELVPCFGAFNIPASLLAAEGIPIFPRSVLISTKEIAADMLTSMGEHKACVLRGHGITVIGDNVEQALVRALSVNTLAQVTLQVAQAGGKTSPIPPEDLALLPDLGGKFNDLGNWRYYRAKLRRLGYDE